MPMDSHDFYKAYLIWTYRFGHLETDGWIETFLELSPRNLDLKSRGWIERAREAQQLPLERVAQKIGISKEAWRKLERNETRQKISMESLQKAAEALDCELVYGFQPKAQVSFSRLLWRQIGPVALEIYRKRTQTARIKPLILGNIADKLMRDPRFRKKQGWSRNQPRKKSN